MLEIGTSGSVRGVDAHCMAEYCDTPRSKEGSNREYKECLSIRAIVHLLDWFRELKLGHLVGVMSLSQSICFRWICWPLFGFFWFVPCFVKGD
jgi:hypothetical protein